MSTSDLPIPEELQNITRSYVTGFKWLPESSLERTILLEDIKYHYFSHGAKRNYCYSCGYENFVSWSRSPKDSKVFEEYEDRYEQERVKREKRWKFIYWKYYNMTQYLSDFDNQSQFPFKFPEKPEECFMSFDPPPAFMYLCESVVNERVRKMNELGLKNELVEIIKKTKKYIEDKRLRDLEYDLEYERMMKNYKTDEEKELDILVKKTLQDCKDTIKKDDEKKTHERNRERSLKKRNLKRLESKRKSEGKRKSKRNSSKLERRS